MKELLKKDGTTKEKNVVKTNIRTMGLLNLLMDFKLYGAFAIIYYSQISNSMMLGMSIFSITMIASAIFEFPTGIIADKIGRKNTVIKIQGAVLQPLF